MTKRKKRTTTEPGDMDSLEYARALVRKAWAELGIDEPEDTVTYVRGLVRKAMAELAERRASSA